MAASCFSTRRVLRVALCGQDSVGAEQGGLVDREERSCKGLSCTLIQI